MKKINLMGKVFGELTVLSEASERKHGQVMWVCRCSCGKKIEAFSANLRKKQRSCGCLVKTRNGLSSTPEYLAWRNMLARCYYTKDVSYQNYGARGVEVCGRWRESFDTFLADVGLRPQNTGGGHTNYSLDRIDNTKNYEPDNVRWAEWATQQNNRRSNRQITYNGETRTLAEWSGVTGLGRATIAYRLDHGWSEKEALSRTPHCGKPPQKVGV